MSEQLELWILPEDGFTKESSSILDSDLYFKTQLKLQPRGSHDVVQLMDH